LITPLVFSRNRPAQLDLLLTSLERNGGDLLGPPAVLFRSDSPDYDRGYAMCAAEHPQARLVEEYDFQGQVSRVVEGVERLSSPLFVGLTDDDVLYRDLRGFSASPERMLLADEDLLWPMSHPWTGTSSERPTFARHSKGVATRIRTHLRTRSSQGSPTHRAVGWRASSSPRLSGCR
jgi:hypothetical protein